MGLPLLRRQADLLRHSGFRLLFLATLGSGVGSWLAFIALQIDIKERTDSGVWISALLVAEVVPMFAIGVFLGPVIDRVSRRGLMIAADLMRFGVFAALPFTESPAVIVALAGVAGFATGVFRPAVYAGLPNLVEDRDLPNANSLLQTIENLTTTIAPLVGGALVAAASPDLPYAINAVSFLLSAALIARIARGSLQQEAPPSAGHLRDVLEGLALVRTSRAVLVVLLAWAVIASTATSGVNVAEIFLAKDSLDAGDFGFGLLVAATGFGLAGGSFVAGSLVQQWGMRRTYALSLLLIAAGIGCAAVSPTVWLAAAALVVSGAGNGAAVVCNAILVQRGVPDRMRGRAFTLLMSATWIFIALGAVAAGPLVDEVGARWVWGAAAALIAVAAAVAFALTPGSDETDPAHPDAIAVAVPGGVELSEAPR